MSMMVYAPAIRDAIKEGNVREMKPLLRHAKKVLGDHGDLKKVVSDLERSLTKLAPTTGDNSRKTMRRSACVFS